MRSTGECVGRNAQRAWLAAAVLLAAFGGACVVEAFAWGGRVRGQRTLLRGDSSFGRLRRRTAYLRRGPFSGARLRRRPARSARRASVSARNAQRACLGAAVLLAASGAACMLFRLHSGQTWPNPPTGHRSTAGVQLTAFGGAGVCGSGFAVGVERAGPLRTPLRGGSPFWPAPLPRGLVRRATVSRPRPRWRRNGSGCVRHTTVPRRNSDPARLRRDRLVARVGGAPRRRAASRL
jgi:hypothetical protein